MIFFLAITRKLAYYVLMINYEVPNSVSQFQSSALRLLSFDDLEFKPHSSTLDNAVHAVLRFENGFSISVVASDMPEGQRGSFYGNVADNEYEIAIYDDNDDYVPLHLSDDVLGWQSPLSVSNYMREAQINGKSWAKLLQKSRDDHRKDLGLDN